MATICNIERETKNREITKSLVTTLRTSQNPNHRISGMKIRIISVIAISHTKGIYSSHRNHLFLGFGMNLINLSKVSEILFVTDPSVFCKLSEYQCVFLANQDKGFIIGCFVNIGVINIERKSPTMQKTSKYPPIRSMEFNSSLLFTTKSRMNFRIVGKVKEIITIKESMTLTIAERYSKSNNKKENILAKKVPWFSAKMPPL